MSEPRSDGATGAGFCVGGHFRHLYRDQGEREALLARFVEDALHMGYAVLVVAGAEGAEEAQRAASAWARRSPAADEAGRLFLWGLEAFLDEEGRPDPAGFVRRASGAAGQAADHGLALAVDYGSLRDDLADPYDVLRCEELIDRLVGGGSQPGGEVRAVLSLIDFHAARQSTKDVALERLKERAAYLEELFMASPSAAMVFRRQEETGVFVAVDFNPAALEHAGLQRRQIIGRRLEEVVPAELADQFSSVVEAVWGDGATRTVRGSRKSCDGIVGWIECQVVRLAGGEVMTVCEDITEQVAREADLRRALDHLETLIRACPVPIVGVDNEDRVTIWNPAAEITFGWAIDEVFGKPIPWVPEGLESESLSNRRYQAGGGIFAGERFARRRKDGALREVAFYTAPLFNREGRVTSATGVALDITEHIEAAQALRESEERYRRVVEIAQEGIWLADPDAGLLFVNGFMADLLGYEPVEMIGRRAFEFLDPQDADLVRRAFESRSVDVPIRQEVRFRRRDGVHVHTDTSFVPMFDDGGAFTGVLAMVSDVTAQRELEHERLRAAKMESLATLAGGVAHDFNNLLTGIMGNISLARETAEPREQAELLDAAEDAARRAVGLTRQLLTFAHGAAPVKKVGSVHDLVRQSVSFILAGSQVQPVFNLGETFAADFDASQIEQVIQNLTVNAKQAMPGGGRLLISTRDFVEDDGRAFVQLTIADEGSGISPEDLDKLFDPYFTTKPGGTGLGLAVVHSVVSRHNGYITVDSVPGEGTTFRIYLPASEGELEAQESSEADPDRVQALQGRALVVDDQEAIRTFLERMLGSAGLEVTLCADGSEAFRCYQDMLARGERFDLVVTDLTMPGGMSGEQLCRELVALDPNATIVVSSGYADKAVMSDFQACGAAAFLQKPYTAQAVRALVRRLLGA